MPIAPNPGALASAFYSQPPNYADAAMYGLIGPTPPRTLPCIALMCSNCGHLQFYSVLQLGLGVALGVVASLIPEPEGQ